MYARLDVNLRERNETMHEKYKNILNDLDIYVFGNPMHFKFLSHEFFGKKIARAHMFDCTNQKTAFFMDRLQKLDGLSFGTTSMAMERWMFYDCAAMPSCIIGLGIPADLASEKTRELFGITDESDETLIPLSMYIALPSMKEGHWFGHNLCSLSSKINQYYGLGLLTKAMGICLYDARHLMGATQWTSEALSLHTQLADMYLLTSFTPNHSKENTLTYYSHYTDETIELALSGQKREAEQESFWIDVKDLSSQKDLQQKIEKGGIYFIGGRAMKKEKGLFYPIVDAN